MGKISGKMLAVFAAATLAGSCLHFVYAIFPNVITALVSPVNESLWEHLKILFWPYLAAALFLTRGGERGCRAPWLASLLLQSAAMLALGWLYHVPLAGEDLLVDVALYVVCMAAGFLLPGLLRPLGDRAAFREGVVLAAAVLAAAILLFTFLPPDHILFADLSALRTWRTIPLC